jgi:hypothetical protein
MCDRQNISKVPVSLLFVSWFRGTSDSCTKKCIMRNIRHGLYLYMQCTGKHAKPLFLVMIWLHLYLLIDGPTFTVTSDSCKKWCIMGKMRQECNCMQCTGKHGKRLFLVMIWLHLYTLVDGSYIDYDLWFLQKKWCIMGNIRHGM